MKKHRNIKNMCQKILIFCHVNIRNKMVNEQNHLLGKEKLIRQILNTTDEDIPTKVSDTAVMFIGIGWLFFCALIFYLVMLIINKKCRKSSAHDDEREIIIERHLSDNEDSEFVRTADLASQM